MRTKTVLAALAAAVFMLAGCTAGDNSEGGIFNDPITAVSGADGSAPGSEDPEESKEEITDNVKGVKLTMATEYYISGQSEDIMTACKALVKGAKDFNDKISLKGLGLNAEDLADIITVMISCEPELWMIDPAYSYSADPDKYITEVSFKYTSSKKDYEKALKKLKQKVDGITDKTTGQSDFEKLREFHDTIIKGCEYSDESDYPYSAYGCLMEGKAVCEGYSKALCMMCNAVGIECIPILGSANDSEVESHMWNKVCLDNEWYNIDVTWDDPVSEIGKDYIGNAYFGITDKQISADHTAEEGRFLKYPKAKGTKYNYFTATNRYIEDVSDADSILLVAITSSAESGTKYVQFKCKDKKTYDMVIDREFTGGENNAHIFEILSNAAQASGGVFSDNSYSIARNDNMLTFTIILNM